jgi:hypothetical protein
MILSSEISLPEGTMALWDDFHVCSFLVKKISKTTGMMLGKTPE